MRIGIDCRFWNESGVGRYTRNLVRNLSELDKKNQYVLFVLDQDYDDVSNIVDNNWQVVRANIRWHTVKEQLQLPKLITREQIDLMHFPYFSVPVFYDKPFVVTIHDLILHHFPTGEASTLPKPLYYAKLFGYKFVINDAAQKAKKIITVSEATKKELVKHLRVSSDKIVVTYEGIEKIESSSKNEVLHRKPYFLHVGNLYPHKNMNKFLDAFATVVKDTDNIQLRIVGKEDYFQRQFRTKAKELGLTKNIIFEGEVSEYELMQLYKGAAALVVPSLMEGFGLPALEAMGYGCLVLASGIDSLKEVCQDAAVYFDPQSTESMVNSMRRVIKNAKDFDKYIEKGKERAKAFSWQKMATETLKVYESCVSV